MQLRISKSISDYLKILCAIIVALHHYSLYICANNLSDSIFFKLLSAQGGYIGVAFFFMLSGYGLMESEKRCHLNFLPFLRKRFMRVYLPTLLVTILWWPISYLILGDSSPFIDRGGNLLIISLLYDFGDSYLWFIKVILIQYLLFDLFIVVQNRCNKIQTILLINLLAAIGMAIAMPIVSTASIISIPLFYYGVMLSRFDKGNRTHFLTHFGMLIFWAIAICIMLHLKGHATINAIINYGAMLIATIIMLKLDIRRPLPFAGFLGAISFDLYLIHGKCLTFITHQYPQGALPTFLLLAATATLLFHFLRTRLKL